WPPITNVSFEITTIKCAFFLSISAKKETVTKAILYFVSVIKKDKSLTC
ncbi:MAG: hypothetical protein ACJA1B_002619, partial [Polaribacter sp.]